MGWENITAVNGVAIAITGMLIVFTALTLVSLFIAALPRMLTVINEYVPETHGHHGGAPAAAKNDAPTAIDDEAVAALAVIWHERR